MATLSPIMIQNITCQTKAVSKDLNSPLLVYGGDTGNDRKHFTQTVQLSLSDMALYKSQFIYCLFNIYVITRCSCPLAAL